MHYFFRNNKLLYVGQSFDRHHTHLLIDHPHNLDV